VAGLPNTKALIISLCEAKIEFMADSHSAFPASDAALKTKHDLSDAVNENRSGSAFISSNRDP
jgi:hypothetical protein